MSDCDCMEDNVLSPRNLDVSELGELGTGLQQSNEKTIRRLEDWTNVTREWVEKIRTGQNKSSTATEMMSMRNGRELCTTS